MCAAELSSFQTFLGKHLIHCNQWLRLRHPPIQLPTRSKANQHLLCLTEKKQQTKEKLKKKQTHRTIFSDDRDHNMKSVRLNVTRHIKFTKMTITSSLSTSISPPSLFFLISSPVILIPWYSKKWLPWDADYFNVTWPLMRVTRWVGAVPLTDSQGLTQEDRNGI